MQKSVNSALPGAMTTFEFIAGEHRSLTKCVTSRERHTDNVIAVDMLLHMKYRLY
uniref:Uncharacterized protein n=1 Tax=Arion vulgaris TaxID=1028688 RepID=A0A0B6YA46_9EUPU